MNGNDGSDDSVGNVLAPPALSAQATTDFMHQMREMTAAAVSSAMEAVKEGMKKDAAKMLSQPAKPKLQRKGLQTQLDFNEEIKAFIKADDVEAALAAIADRNELLCAADDNPAIFEVLENKMKAADVKNPMLAQALEEVAKEKKRDSRKHPRSPSARRPFRAGGVARHPALHFGSAPFGLRDFGYQRDYRSFEPAFGRQDRSRDLCRSCGQQGHWASDCPQANSTAHRRH